MKIEIKRENLTLRGLLEGTDNPHPDKLAIIFHGFKSDLGYQSPALTYEIAQQLKANQLPSLRMNFAGSGDSDGRFVDMTVNSEIADAMAIINYAHYQMGVKHLYLVGHSQGGVVASMVAPLFNDWVEKLVLCSPAATLKDDAWQGICQGSTYDPMHIPEAVDVHGFQVGGNYFRTAQYLPIYETAQHFQGECLIIAGSNDQVVDPEASRKYHVILPTSKLYLLPGADHALAGQDGQRQKALQLVSDFLMK